MRSVRRLLPPLALGLLSLPVFAAARSWYVSTTGDDANGNGSSAAPFATIGHATRLASDGDTVRVLPGLYRECVNASGKSLTFVSTASEATPPSSLVTIVDGTGICGGNSCANRKSVACYGPAANYCVGTCDDLVCSVTTTQHCLVDTDCPTGEKCSVTATTPVCTNDPTATCTRDTCTIASGATTGTCANHPSVTCTADIDCGNLDCDFGACGRIEGKCSASGAFCVSSADCAEGETCDPLAVAPVFDVGTGSSVTGFTIYGGGLSAVHLTGSGTVSRNRIAASRATGADGGAILVEPAPSVAPEVCWGNTALACTADAGCHVCRDDPSVACAIGQDCVDAAAGSVCVQWGPCLAATEVHVESNAITDNASDGAGPGHGGGAVCLRAVTLADSGTRLVLTGNQVLRNTSAGSGGGVLALAAGAGLLSLLVDDNVLDSNAGQDGGALAVSASLAGPAAGADVSLVANHLGSNEASGRGGGAYVDLEVAGDAHLVATGNAVHLNTSVADGGGLLLRVVGDGAGVRRLEATANEVSGNAAGGSGGGLDLFLSDGASSVEAGSLAASGNDLTGNSAAAGGGGLFAELVSGSAGAVDSMTIENNNIRKNSARSFGGGVVVATDSEGAAGATSQFSRNLVAENVAAHPDTADATGGGLFLYLRGGAGRASTALDFGTIASNTTDAGAAAVEIESDGAPGGSSRITISNSILANNHGIGVGGPLARDRGKMQSGGTRDLQVTVTYTDVYGNSGIAFERTLAPELTVDATVVESDPKLVHDYSLALCSAAIDAADPAADASAEPQPNGGRSNLGNLGGTASAPPTLPDLNGDGQVDGLDLLWITAAFGSDRVLTPGRYFAPADVDRNGAVDGDDLAYVAAFFGLSCP